MNHATLGQKRGRIMRGKVLEQGNEEAGLWNAEEWLNG
jgi:hypothetical protein